VLQKEIFQIYLKVTQRKKRSPNQAFLLVTFKAQYNLFVLSKATY